MKLETMGASSSTTISFHKKENCTTVSDEIASLRPETGTESG